MEPLQSATRRSGRPRSFDVEAALEQAMLTFWRYGYEGSSIGALTGAMGISAPSLYAAFGDKRRLFLAAMRRYAGDPEVLGGAIDAAPTAREAAERMLVGAATAYTGETTPKGCLLASATASGSAASRDVQRAVTKVRQAIEARLRARIERDIAGGVLPPHPGAATLAGIVMAVTQGLSVLARDGAARPALIAIADAALAGWPPPRQPPTGTAGSRH